MQILKAIGIVLFLVGLGLVIASRIPKKTIIKDENHHFILTARRTFVDKFASPSYPCEFHIIFADMPHNKIYFILEHWISRYHGGFGSSAPTKFETTKVFPGRMRREKKVKFSLNPDPTCEYLVHAGVVDGLKTDGYEQILDIFHEYGFQTKSKEYPSIISKKELHVVSETEGEKFDICVDDFLKKSLYLFCTNLRGSSLYSSLLVVPKYGNVIKMLNEKFPTLLDKIAETVEKYTERVDTTCTFQIVRVDYLGEWIFHIGLLLITTSVVVYLAPP